MANWLQAAIETQREGQREREGRETERGKQRERETEGLRERGRKEIERE